MEDHRENESDLSSSRLQVAIFRKKHQGKALLESSNQTEQSCHETRDRLNRISFLYVII